MAWLVGLFCQRFNIDANSPFSGEFRAFLRFGGAWRTPPGRKKGRSEWERLEGREVCSGLRQLSSGSARKPGRVVTMMKRMPMMTESAP